LHMRLFPALVQGDGSVEAVCRAIQYFSRTKWPDVLIVGRGGGSLEDLWTFNTEPVARAIAACEVPVVSAVGHETDVTIADFVADLRAPTPSAAAELIVGTREAVAERVESARHRAVQVLRYRLAMLGRRLHQQGIDRVQGLLTRRIGRAQQRIDDHTYRLKDLARTTIDSRERVRRGLEARLARFDMRPRLAADRRRLDAAHAFAIQLARTRVARDRGRLERLSAQLGQLSPLKILERGYAIVSNERGIVKDAASAPLDSAIHVRLGKGELNARVIVKGS